MKKIIKIALITVSLTAIIALCAWYFVFIWPVSHHRNAENETGIIVTSSAIIAAYENNERKADSLYLDKTVQVTGEITEIKINQAGKQTIMLRSDDPMSGVFCTLKRVDSQVRQGVVVTIKGICTGYLSDLVIIDAVIVNNKSSETNN